MDARSFAMRPGNRDFADDEPKLLSQVEQFRIESPALDLLQGKNSLRAAPGEGLEPALRILELQAQNDAQRQVEDASEEPAMHRLPPNLQSTIHPARANGDVCAVLNRGKQLIRLLNRRREISIAEQQ